MYGGIRVLHMAVFFIANLRHYWARATATTAFLRGNDGKKGTRECGRWGMRERRVD